MPTLPVLARRTCTCVNHYCSHHQALRASLQPIVTAGKATCWRCNKAIAPDELWDLGHDDDDRTLYRGIECRKCNRATSGRRRTKEPRRWSM